MFSNDEQQTTEFLISLCRQVSEAIILPYFMNGDFSVDEKFGPQDLVTNADREAEEFMVGKIRSSYPGSGILGEESSSADGFDPMLALVARDCFIIDPIDGTWNFAHGLTTFAVALAHVESGEVKAGILHDPILGTTVHATKGQGAYLRNRFGKDKKISAQSGRAGFLPTTSLPRGRADAAIDVGHSISPIKALGSSAHEYRMLAQGLASWSYAAKSLPWDHAAGALIYSEAGGITRYADGTEYTPFRMDSPIVSAADEATWQALTSGLTIALS